MFGVGAVDLAAFADIGERAFHGLRVDAGAAQGAAGIGVAGDEGGEHTVLRHVGVAGGGGLKLGGIQRADEFGGGLGGAGAVALHLGDAGEGRVVGGADLCRVPAGGTDEAGGRTFLVVQERLEQVFGGEALVEIADGDGLGGLQEAAGAFGEFFHVHGDWVPLRRLRFPRPSQRQRGNGRGGQKMVVLSGALKVFAAWG